MALQATPHDAARMWHQRCFDPRPMGASTLRQAVRQYRDHAPAPLLATVVECVAIAITEATGWPALLRDKNVPLP